MQMNTFEEGKIEPTLLIIQETNKPYRKSSKLWIKMDYILPIVNNL